jgi:iron complex outermembrane recepter protein
MGRTLSKGSRLGFRSALLASVGVFALTSVTAYADEPAIEEMVVTGTNLQNAGATSIAPITAVSGEALLQKGPGTIDEVLKSIPQLKPDNGASATLEGGAGVAKANLRALGPTRTLVLVNGRRFIPADSSGLVDLATIPEALLDRVDILTGGASAVYGSDAIGGAINFVLKNNFEGATASYSYGETFIGDAATHKFDGTIGGNFAGDRGNVVFSASYLTSGNADSQSRSFSKDLLLETANGLQPFRSSAVEGGRVTAGSGFVGVGPAQGACTSGSRVRFAAGGAPVVYCTPENDYNSQAFFKLKRPVDRYQVSTLTRYEINDDIEVYGEGFYVNARNTAERNPDQFRGNLVLPGYAANPTIPQVTRDFLSANAAIFDPSGSGRATIPLRIRFPQLGSAAYEFDRNSFGVTGGLRGNLPLLGSKDWKWDVHYSYQRATQVETDSGQLSLARLALGSDVVVNNGVATCRTNILGCVPVNILGINALTPAMAAFLAPVRTQHSVFDRNMVGGTLSGEVFDVPAGPVAVAVGFEHRDESYKFTPSAEDAAGSFQQASTGPAIAGGVKVTEFFGEVGVPLLRDAPFAHLLAAEAGYRYSDYTRIGGVSTYKGGLKWQPVDDSFTLRGGYNRAIRAPNLAELFSSRTSATVSGTDPCAAINNPSAAVRALCVQNGVPAASIATFAPTDPFIRAVSGGNPALTEEKANTYTLGAMYQPSFVPNLNITVDYFHITVNGAVGQITAQQFLNQCASSLDPNSVFCQAISRDANGFILNVNAASANIAKRVSSGIDVAANWSTDLPWSGIAGQGSELLVNFSNTYQIDDTTQTFAGQAAVECAGHYDGNVCSGLAGRVMTPRVAGYIQGTIKSGPASFGTRVNWIGGFTPAAGINANIKSVPAIAYVDINAGYEIGENIKLSGGIINLGDKNPPIIGFDKTADANTDQVLYDTLGRRFFLRVAVTF